MRTDRFSTRAALLLVSCLTIMAGATIAPALPSMQVHFSEVNHAGLLVRLIITLPALFIVIAAPFAGWFLDHYGRLRLLIPSLVLYGIAGSSGLYLDSISAILAGRALLGVAVAGIMTSATTLIADYYEGQARSQFMGWQAAFMNLGGIVFLTAGGGLTELGWRWPFSIYLFSLILIPLVVTSLTEPVKIVKNPVEKTDQVTVGTTYLKLLAAIYVITFLGMIIFYTIPVQIPFYLHRLVNAGPAATGIAIASMNLFGMMVAFNYRRILNRFGHITILVFTFGLMGIGYMVIGSGESYPSVLTGLIIGGLGAGLMFPNMNFWLTSSVPASIRGRALGGLTTAIFLGQFMSPIAAQPIVVKFGLETLFVGGGMALLVFALICVLFRRGILAFMKPATQPVVEKTPVVHETIPAEVD